MPKLIARNGDKKGTEYPLERRTFILGRARKCDIAVPSVKASRRHAEVFFENGSFRLKDLGSSNGTLLNGRRIDGAVALQSGDRFQIGQCLLEFFDESAPAPIRVAGDAPAAASAAAEVPPAPGPQTAAGPEPAAQPEPEPASAPPGRRMSGSDRDLLVIVLVVAAIVAALGGYLLVRSLRGGSAPPAAGAESGAPLEP